MPRGKVSKPTVASSPKVRPARAAAKPDMFGPSVSEPKKGKSHTTHEKVVETETKESLNKLTKAKLQEMLTSKGQDVTGTKAVLIDRILKAKEKVEVDDAPKSKAPPKSSGTKGGKEEKIKPSDLESEKVVFPNIDALSLVIIAAIDAYDAHGASKKGIHPDSAKDSALAAALKMAVRLSETPDVVERGMKRVVSASATKKEKDRREVNVSGGTKNVITKPKMTKPREKDSLQTILRRAKIAGVTDRKLSGITKPMSAKSYRSASKGKSSDEECEKMAEKDHARYVNDVRKLIIFKKEFGVQKLDTPLDGIIDRAVQDIFELSIRPDLSHITFAEGKRIRTHISQFIVENFGTNFTEFLKLVEYPIPAKTVKSKPFGGERGICIIVMDAVEYLFHTKGHDLLAALKDGAGEIHFDFDEKQKVDALICLCDAVVNYGLDLSAQ